MPRYLVRSCLVLAIFAATFGPATARSAEPAAEATKPKTAAKSDAEKPNDVQEAFAQFRKGDAEGAVKLLNEAAKKNPELPPARVILAGWYANMDDSEMARNALEQATIESPKDPEAWFLLGDRAARERKVAEAGLLYEKAYELAKAADEPSPRIVNVRKRSLGGLAMISEARQDWKTAQERLEALLAEAPKDAGAMAQLGRALFHQQKIDEAVERFRQAAKLNDEMLGAEAQVAQLFQQAGDAKNAATWMVKAIEADPRDYKTRVAAAQWSEEIGRYDQAVEQAKAAVQLSPDALGAQLLRARSALFQKDYPTAEEYFRKAHLQSPGNAAAINGMAQTLIAQDDEAKKKLALEYAQLNARQFSDQPDALATLGWVLLKLDRTTEAESNLNRAVSLAQSRPGPDLLYYYASLLAKQGRKDEAKRLLDMPAMTSSRYLMKDEAAALRKELTPSQ